MLLQFSDENNILIDKSILERYRKCMCCVFIDFEYINLVSGDMLQSPSVQCLLPKHMLRNVCILCAAGLIY